MPMLESLIAPVMPPLRPPTVIWPPRAIAWMPSLAPVLAVIEPVESTLTAPLPPLLA